MTSEEYSFSFIQEKILAISKQIMEQREEILKAFIAKYGFAPDEAVQVIEYTHNGTRWYVEKRRRKEDNG
jgi:hypothetical protein